MHYTMQMSHLYASDPLKPETVQIVVYRGSKVLSVFTFYVLMKATGKPVLYQTLTFKYYLNCFRFQRV